MAPDGNHSRRSGIEVENVCDAEEDREGRECRR